MLTSTSRACSSLRHTMMLVCGGLCRHTCSLACPSYPATRMWMASPTSGPCWTLGSVSIADLRLIMLPQLPTSLPVNRVGGQLTIHAPPHRSSSSACLVVPMVQYTWNCAPVIGASSLGGVGSPPAAALKPRYYGCVRCTRSSSCLTVFCSCIPQCPCMPAIFPDVVFIHVTCMKASLE